MNSWKFLQFFSSILCSDLNFNHSSKEGGKGFLMGSLISLPRNTPVDERESSHIESCKRPRISSILGDNYGRLIPSLPDEMSLMILARMPRISYVSMKLVSRSWKAAVTGSEVFKLRRELGMAEEWLYLLTKVEEERLLWHALDPVSGSWQRLPPMPDMAREEEGRKGLSVFGMWNAGGLAEIIRGWLGQRDMIKRMPFCGCAIGVVDGCLYVLGGFSRESAIKSVLRYDPRVNQWQEVSSMTTGRAFCKTSLLNDKLYVVGGVSRVRGGLTPLQTGEVYDPDTDVWTQMPNMTFSKAHALPTAFLAEMLKPIATGMTSYKGRLCVPQSLYSWPFFVDVGGEIYDPETDSWVEMPAGMGEGWPARQAGAKLSVVVDGELYALDPSSSLGDGKIKIYDEQEDAWKVIYRKVPVHDFLDSESTYLLAGFHEKLHVITKDANSDTTILRADLLKDVNLSASTSCSGADSPSANEDRLANVWSVIAAKNLGAEELVSCQVLKI